jgi:hypothetical protein
MFKNEEICIGSHSKINLLGILNKNKKLKRKGLK